MKKYFILVCILSLFIPLFASEWGGVITNESYLKSKDFSSYNEEQKNNLFIWYTTPIGDSGFNFSVEGLYSFHYYPDYPKNQKISHSIDFDLFKISKNFYNEKSSAILSVGRFSFSDIASVFFNQKIDGALVKINTDKNILSFFAGYTGLLNELNVSILDRYGIAYSPEAQVYSLAYPFVVLDFSVYFPNLFLSQNVAIEMNSALDFGAEGFNRYYFETQLDGLLFKYCYYALTAIVQTFDFKDFSLYASLENYIEINDSMFFDFGAEYASGFNGKLKPFIGVSSRPVTNSYTSKETTSMISPYLKFVLVKDKVSFNIAARYMLNCQTDDIKNDGFEVDVSSSINLFTDFQLQLGVLSYTSLSENNNSNYGAFAKLSLAF